MSSYLDCVLCISADRQTDRWTTDSKPGRQETEGGAGLSTLTPTGEDLGQFSVELGQQQDDQQVENRSGNAGYPVSLERSRGKEEEE